MKIPHALFISATLVGTSLTTRADVSSLSLGLDYRLRGIAILNSDTQTAPQGNLNYYSQSAEAYLTSQLNQNTEAQLRVRSLNIWGLEGSGAPLTSYPAADGSFWVQRASLRLSQLAGNHVALTFGRQPFVLGEGVLVSDDGRGFNSLLAEMTFSRGITSKLFTAKINESLGQGGDSDLHVASLGLQREDNLWEISWVREKTGSPTTYQLATGTTTASNIQRDFFDIRFAGDLKDAYYRLELALEKGDAQIGAISNSISGSAQRIELGAQTDASRWGRFGVKGLYASGTGDDSGTPSEDESFRPTFAKRWNGLERDGFGSYYGATLSDVFNPAAPFSADGSGLPLGASGIKTLGLGLFTVQRVRWTFGLDYYMFDSRVKVSGENALGAEADLSLIYRHSANVSFQAGAAYFFPGALYGPTASRVSRYSAETQFHF
jgi:hypothetical protein